MPCCGQARTALKNASPVSHTITPAPQPAAKPAHMATTTITAPIPPKPVFHQSPTPAAVRRFLPLEYLSASRIVVSGPATGTPYEFSSARRVQAVDARDAEVLLKTAFFRLQRPSA